MNLLHSRLSTGAVVSVMLLVLPACAETKPSSFYTLSSLRATGALGDGVDPEGLAIALGPIALPQYLDRPQIVTRVSPNRLKLAEFDKWAEPFKDIFTRVLAENLSHLLDTDRIVILPSRRARVMEYYIEVDVVQFDTEVSGKTLLDARWSIFGLEDQEPLVIRRSVHIHSISNPNDFEAIVAAMSRSLGDLSQEIAEAIRSIAI